MKKAVTIKEFRKNTGIHITEAHTGKMEGMVSLSTACGCNPFCMARRNCAGSICQKCYAASMAARYKTLNAALTRNFEALNAREIPVEEWPLLNVGRFRLESFGDVASATQARNYINFCKRNPRTVFAAWTKNPQVWAEALRAVEKPKNLILILSSPMIGRIADKTPYPFIDKVFTVWADDESAQAAGVKINCGARHCLSCGRCYSKRGAEYVHELLK